MQLSFNKRTPGPVRSARTLGELPCGEAAVIESLDLPSDLAERLMELGFLPGTRVTVAHCAPGGDPRVFRVEGTEVALRRETANRLAIKM